MRGNCLMLLKMTSKHEICTKQINCTIKNPQTFNSYESRITYNLTAKVLSDIFQVCCNLLTCISLKCSKVSYFHTEAISVEEKSSDFVMI